MKRPRLYFDAFLQTYWLRHAGQWLLITKQQAVAMLKELLK